MDKFSYAQPEDVVPLVKGSVTGPRMELLEYSLYMSSVRLSAWYPGLKKAWEQAEEGSEIKELVTVMIMDAGRKVLSNPEGMSSETIGPYAYSRFDSEDWVKSLFLPRDLLAIEEFLLAEERKPVRGIKMNLDTMPPAAPVTTSGRYTNSDYSYRARRRQRGYYY